MAEVESGYTCKLDREIAQICEFLQNRGLSAECIEKLRREKKDASAVMTADDQVLADLGIKSKGDVLSLRSFVRSLGKERGERDEKKKKLLDILKRKKRPKAKESKESEALPSFRKISLGWLHFDKKLQKYVSVRMKKGGGTRTVTANMKSTVEDLITLAESTFFPDGQSIFGMLSNMVSNLGNFKCQPLPREDFTLSQYISKNSLTTVRLYLMTREEDDDLEFLDCWQTTQPTQQQNVLSSAKSSATATCTTSALIDLTSSSVMCTSACNLSTNRYGSTNEQNTSTSTVGQLIGTSSEREILKQQQDQDFMTSLAADQEKEKQKLKENADVERKMQIRAARSARIPPEPADGEPEVHISVRHVTLGVLRRKFKATENMSSVYDWVGSMDIEPESFVLSGCRLPELKPSLSITVANKVILNMTESDAVPGYPEEELNFLGYGHYGDCNDTVTDSWTAMDSIIPETPPAVLMEGDIPRKEYKIEERKAEDNMPVHLRGSGQTKRKKKKKAGTRKKADKGHYFRQVSLPCILNQQCHDQSRDDYVKEADAVQSSDPDNAPVPPDSSDELLAHNSPVQSPDPIDAPVPTDSDDELLSLSNQVQLSDPIDVPTVPPNSSDELLAHNNQVQSSDSIDAAVPSDLDNETSNIASTRVLRIKRTYLMNDMIEKFKDDKIMKQTVSVVMVNAFGNEERAVDINGVFLDALSAFWTSFFDSCSNGEEERVPIIRHDYQSAEWESVGRILVKGYQQLKFFPVKLNKAFFVAALYGESEVTDAMLLSSFMGYISQDERDLVSLAIDNKLDEDQQEEWCEFLERFGCKFLPTPEKVRSVILEIAHKEIIQHPLYIIESWSPPLRLMRQAHLSNVSLVEELFDKPKPTNKKVLTLLHANPVNYAQREALSYLQRYIRGANEEKLTKFLRFCTGSTMICVSQIKVMFTNLDGLARRPVSHTCGAVLELPVTYQSFPQFREEMNNIFSSQYWEMDFV